MPNAGTIWLWQPPPISQAVDATTTITAAATATKIPNLIDWEGFENQIKTVSATANLGTKQWDLVEDVGNVITFVTGRDGIGKAVQIALNGTNTGRLNRNYATPGTLFVVSFYFKLVSTPTGATMRIFQSIADASCHIGINTSGQVLAAFGAGTSNVIGTGPSVTDGAWHRIDARIDSGPATHTIDWYCDGTLQTQAHSGLVAASNQTSWNVGSNIATATGTFQVDDLVLSATSGNLPIGAHTVFSTVPSDDNAESVYGTGVMQQATGVDLSSSNKGYQYLDDWPPTTGVNNADSVTQAAAGAGNFVSVEFGDAPAYVTTTALWGVSAVAAIQSDGVTANNGTTRIVDAAGNTLTDVFSGDMSETGQHYTRAKITAPAGGWTKDGFNAARARIGFSTDSTTDPEWLALMLTGVTVDVPTGATTNQSIDASVTFTAGLTRQTGKVLTAVATFTVLMTRMVLHPMAVTVSMVAAIVRSTLKTLAVTVAMNPAVAKSKAFVLAATVTFTVAVSRRVGKPLAATATFTAALSRTTGKALAVAVTFTVALVRSTAKLMATSVTFTVAMAKRVGKPLAVAVTLTPALSRQVGKTLANAVTFTAALATSKVKVQLLAVTVTFTAAITRRVAKTIAATTTFTAAVTRTVGKPLAVTVTFGANLVRQVNKPVAVAVTFAAALVRRIGKPLANTVTFTAALATSKVKVVVIAVTVTFTASLARQVSKLLAASATFTASLTRRSAKLLASTATFTASVTKNVILSARAVTVTFTGALSAQFHQGAQQFQQAIDVTVTFTANVSRRVGKPLANTVAFAAAVTKTITKTIAGSITFTAAMVRSKVKVQVLAVTATFTASVRRQTGKLMPVTVTFTTALTRRVGKVLDVPLTMVANIGKRIPQRVALVVTFTAQVGRRIPQRLAATVTFTAALSRSVGKRIAATATFTAALARSITRSVVVAVAVTFDAAMTRMTSKALDVVFVLDVQLMRLITKTLSVAVEMGAVLRAISSKLVRGYTVKGPTSSKQTNDGATNATDTDNDPWGANVGEGR